MFYFQYWFYELFETLLTFIVCIMLMLIRTALAVIQLLDIAPATATPSKNV